MKLQIFLSEGLDLSFFSNSLSVFEGKYVLVFQRRRDFVNSSLVFLARAKNPPFGPRFFSDVLVSLQAVLAQKVTEQNGQSGPGSLSKRLLKILFMPVTVI